MPDATPPISGVPSPETYCHSVAGSRPWASLMALQWPRAHGRFQIEVHPHAAMVNLFDLTRIVKYKRGRRAARARELRRLRALMLSRLRMLDPALPLRLPGVPNAGNLKPVEDQIDAVLCAYIAAHWWFWAGARNRVYGGDATGYIVVPERKTNESTQAASRLPHADSSSKFPSRRL